MTSVRRRGVGAAAVVVVAAALAIPAVLLGGGSSSRCADGRTVRVDLGVGDAQNEGHVFGASLSADGRYVAFGSDGTGLVPGDDNGVSDVFVRDLRTGTTTRVSVPAGGGEANGPSWFPELSATGRYVTFRSVATNLVPGDRNRLEDIFLRDLKTGSTERVSIGADGAEGNGKSVQSEVSVDGRYVEFTSLASNLVPDDHNGLADVFVRDRLRGTTVRVSIGGLGEPNGRSEGSSFSQDGHVVAFRSLASNLVPGDTNAAADDFVRNWITGTIERVDVSSWGHQSNDTSFRVFLSGDGRFAAFRSRAGDLVPGDANEALDVFEHDIVHGTTTRISVSSAGAEVVPVRRNWGSSMVRFMSHAVLSTTGRYAAFGSRAGELVVGDTNGGPDVFLHDLETGSTIRVSVAANGNQVHRGSYVAGISGDGSLVLFYSAASNLVCGDTNHRRDLFVRIVRPERGVTVR